MKSVDIPFRKTSPRKDAKPLDLRHNTRMRKSEVPFAVIGVLKYRLNNFTGGNTLGCGGTSALGLSHR